MAETKKLTSGEVVKKLQTLNPKDTDSIEKIKNSLESMGRANLRSIKDSVESLLKTVSVEKIKVLEEIQEKIQFYL